MAKVAIMGHGVVGSGVAELLLHHADTISKRANERLEVAYILDLRSFPQLDYADRFITEFDPIEADRSVSVVVETMGGLHPAYEYVSRCLKAGKSVVTSNKELVAAKGAELLALAQAHGVNFLFEASVGGGIPIIHPMRQCLAANVISRISGIMNGTTNFILTKMIREQMSFEDALALAQQLGYAERNPAADIEGWDTCRKICILASLAFGHHVYPDSVPTEGITKITLADVEYAANGGYAIKLLGCAEQTADGHILALTAPFLVPQCSPLAVVDDVFNAIMVTGDATGDVLFYGKGAGKLPTASAVVADVIECTKHPAGCDYPTWADRTADQMADSRTVPYRRYLRCSAANPEAVAGLFGEVTMLNRANAADGETAFLTNALTEDALQDRIARMTALGAASLSCIRLAAW